MSSPPESPFSAIVLCGGKSSRMGVDKAFLPFNGMPLWKYQLAFLRGLGPAQLMLSGRSSVDYPDHVERVLDKVPDQGPVAGILAALERCRHPHLLVLAVDMPRVSAELVRRMLNMRRPGCGIIPIIKDEPEPLLALYPREALAVGQQLFGSGIRKARAFARSCENAGLLQPLPCGNSELSSFANWNSPADRHA